MSEERVTRKKDLLAHIDRYWTALTNALALLSPETMTTIQDEHGWTVKDHLVHLYYWERLALYVLQSKPRHAGLDVSEAIYASDDEDIINEVIFQKHQALSLDEALAQLQALQPDLLAALAPLTDEDLQKSYRHYLPDEPGKGDGPPAMNVVYGNSAHHFREHLAWLKALVDNKV